MIRFNFTINNIFSRIHWGGSEKNYFYIDKKLTENKCFSVQISKWHRPINILLIELDLNWKGQDHAGPRFELEILGYVIILNLYDKRHWNYSENRFNTDEETIRDLSPVKED